MPELEIHEIAFDAADPAGLAAFWAALLDREVRPGDMPQDDSVLIAEKPGQPGLLFLRVHEGKTAKNRVHFDLWPTDSERDAGIAKALSLGATCLDDRRRTDGTGWMVLADPEGNEFCIGRGARERAASRPDPNAKLLRDAPEDLPRRSEEGFGKGQMSSDHSSTGWG